MNWLRTNWAIVCGILTVTGAFAQQQIRVQNVERSVEQQAAENKEQRIVREQVIRQDEQLKAIKESQRTQESLLRELLQSQRSIERKVSK